MGFFVYDGVMAKTAHSTSKPSGRPTKLTEAMFEKAEDYVRSHESYGDPVPIIAGLAIELGVDRTTVYKWASENERFSHIFTRVSELQERRLVSGGLDGRFNPAITKMMLTKHGYSDKIETDHTSSDGSMTPPTRIELVPLLPKE